MSEISINMSIAEVCAKGHTFLIHARRHSWRREDKALHLRGLWQQRSFGSLSCHSKVAEGSGLDVADVLRSARPASGQS